MIFHNDGLTQVSGSPLDLALELAFVIKTIEKRVIDGGGDEDCYQKIIVLSGRLSTLSEEELQNFLDYLPKNTLITFDEIFSKFEEWNNLK